MNSPSRFRAGLTNRLPVFVFLLFVLQPVMDVLSFWTGELGLSNTPTLILRFGVLGVTLLLGFLVSQRKRAYWLAAAAGALLYLGHLFAVFQFGAQNLFADFTNYIRVLQLPLTVLCLITFLKENDRCYGAMARGVLASLLIILAVQLLAVLTGTEPHTYMDGKGYLGWFNNTNSQSAILSMLCPAALVYLYQKKGFRSPLFWITAVGGFAAMFLLGTRLCFLGLVACGFGIGISMILIRPRDWKKALVFAAMAVVCLALMPVSPMVRHQGIYESVQAGRQEAINEMLEDEMPEPLDEANLSEEELASRKAEWIQVLTPVYELYAPDFVELFGPEKTIEMFDYSMDIHQITALRPKKLQFGRLLMDQSPLSARFFGVELDRFTINGNIYDVENDLHGIYFLYGWVGLASMLAFLGYFLFLIIRALVQNAKRYFTLEAAGWGIALLTCLAHVYCTAGVLRRPNASFYLAAVLAAVYYLVRLRACPDPQKR